MSSFWSACVRVPAFLCLALALGAGFTGVVSWSLALAVALVFGLVAQAAGALGRLACERAHRAAAARELEEAISLIPGRSRGTGRKAA